MKLKRIAAVLLLLLLVVLPGCSKNKPPKGTVPTSLTYSTNGQYRFPKKVQRVMKKHFDMEESECAEQDVQVYADLAEKGIYFNTNDPYHPFGDLDLTGYVMRAEDPPTVYYQGRTLRAYSYQRVVAGLQTDEAARIFTDGDGLVLRYETVNYHRYTDLMNRTGDTEENIRLRREAMVQSIETEGEKIKNYDLAVESVKPTSYARPDDLLYMDKKGRAVIRLQITMRLTDERAFPTSYSLHFFGVYDSKKK